MGPRAGLDGCEQSRTHRDSIPGPSRPWRVAIPTDLSRPRFQYYRLYNIIYITDVKISR